MRYHSAEHAQAMARLAEAVGTDMGSLPSRPRPAQQAAPLTGGEIFQAFRDGRQRAETEESPAATFSKGRRRARSTGPTGESMRREESPETPGT